MTPLAIYEATQEHFREMRAPVLGMPAIYFGDGLWLTTMIPPQAREEVGHTIHIGDPSFKFPYES